MTIGDIDIDVDAAAPEVRRAAAEVAARLACANGALASSDLDSSC